jgi:hypothetical protein
MITALADALNDILKLGLETDVLRANIARGIELTAGTPFVDREAGVIHGFSVVTKGEALGHNFLIDEQFLDEIVSQGNRSKLGFKSRFDHPNASSTSMGTVLGRAKNFRKSDQSVRADLHLLDAARKAPDGDLAGYVMDLAEEDPQAFGASIVFHAEFVEQRDEHGEQKKDKEGKPLMRIARLKKLMAVDVVDDPAANPSGFLGQDSLAAKVTTFLDRYFETKIKPTITQEVRAMSIVQTVDPTATIPSAEQLAAATEAGRKAERERVMGIRKVCHELKADAIADELIELGASIEKATETCKLRRLTALQTEAPASAGGGQDHVTDFSGLPEGEEKWKKEFAGSTALQEEFLNKESVYLAFKTAEKNGQVKIYKGHGQKQ